MDADAKDCLDTAANLLMQVINRGHCEPSEAAIIVDQIAQGAIRSNTET